MVFMCENELDTRKAAAYTATRIGGQNAAVCLRGELGAGKTAFVKGFAEKRGFLGDVTSPTFEIIHEYRGGNAVLFHFDLYRVKTLEEALETGVEDYLFSDGVCLIEWYDVIEPLLAGLKVVYVTIEKQERDAECSRVITVDGLQNFGV